MSDELDRIIDRWFDIPIALRKRWWEETDYNRREPSAELIAEVLKWLDEHPR